MGPKNVSVAQNRATSEGHPPTSHHYKGPTIVYLLALDFGTAPIEEQVHDCPLGFGVRLFPCKAIDAINARPIMIMLHRRHGHENYLRELQKTPGYFTSEHDPPYKRTPNLPDAVQCVISGMPSRI